MRRMTIFCSTLVSLVIGGHVFAADPPSEWDWRALNGVSIPKNQGSCGSDWAFAAVGVLESRIMIESGVELDLSEQYVLNCASGGCDGGSPAVALNFIMEEGVVAESVVPYEVAEQPCPNVSGTRYKIDSWYRVFEDAQSVKQAIVESGPLVMINTIYGDFMSYDTGVYDHASGGFLGGHAMILVGYSDSGQYWIAKNSWGPTWGEDGFIRIAYADRDTMDLQYMYALGPLDIQHQLRRFRRRRLRHRRRSFVPRGRDPRLR